jgi:hypothetical protein
MAHENLRDSFSRLVRLVDVDRLVASTPGLDWDEVVRGARSGGLLALLGLSLDLASELLGTPVPAEVRRALRGDRLGRAHLALLRPADGLLHRRLGAAGPSAALVLWLAPGWRSRGALLRRLAAGTDYAEQWIYDFSRANGPPGPAERLRAGVAGTLRLAATEGLLAWRALAGGPLPPSERAPGA